MRAYMCACVQACMRASVRACRSYSMRHTVTAHYQPCARNLTQPLHANVPHQWRARRLPPRSASRLGMLSSLKLAAVPSVLEVGSFAHLRRRHRQPRQSAMRKRQTRRRSCEPRVRSTELKHTLSMPTSSTRSCPGGAREPEWGGEEG